MADASEVQGQSSQLISARTLCAGGEGHEDLGSASPLMRPKIVRKSIDDSVSAPGGIETIYQIGKTLGQYVPVCLPSCIA